MFQIVYSGNGSLLREWAFTGRNIPAQEALSSGLVSHLYKDRTELMQGMTNHGSALIQHFD